MSALTESVDGIRFVATFDSLDPQSGVVVDERDELFACFPTVDRAKKVAARHNDSPDYMACPLDFPDSLTWYSTATGEAICNAHWDTPATNSDSIEFHRCARYAFHDGSCRCACDADGLPDEKAPQAFSGSI